MTHVITQACCNDASCVPVCPVGCIHPDPSEPGFATTEMLYIDPATCIDCGVCVSACPVGAIVPDAELVAAATPYREINAAYYAGAPIEPALELVEIPPPPAPVGNGVLRVAIVGSGPAGSYAAGELLRHPYVEVDVFDRLPTPWGLVRAGVAPDHPSTKSITDVFERTADDSRFRFHLNVEIGDDLSHDELLAHHHAVVYAYGASVDRRLDIPGEQLPGSVAATEFVNWYNGHPDFSDHTFDLSGPRAVIVGNGNVALDIARVLVTDPDRLAGTDIAEYAVAALRGSGIEEVVVLGRRGPFEAAYTAKELLALGDLPGVDVVADAPKPGFLVGPDQSPAKRLKVQLVGEYARRRPVAGNRRIRLRYLASPVAILGEDRVVGVRVVRNRLEHSASGGVNAVPTGYGEIIEASLVVRSVGYRGRAIPGLPFDERRGVIPNDEGRVLDEGSPMTGVYTTGWIKRGPGGVIGTNRTCAQETVAHLIADFAAGRLVAPVCSRADLVALVPRRQPDVVDLAGWRAIDDAERRAGAATGSPRRKITTVPGLVEAASRSQEETFDEQH
jgi:ferredoxin/flavodoxin---NADP+ reductase